MPAIRPPPPTGTKIALRSSRPWPRISIAIVPCPAITSGSSNGWISTRPLAAAQLVAARLGIGERVAGQLDLGAQLAHGIDLDLRRRLRHHDQRADAEVAGREGHALRVVAGAGGDHAAPALVRRQMRHPVVRAAQLEGEDRLQILALQEHLVARSVATAGAPRRAASRADVVDAAGQDQPQHRIGGHSVLSEQMSLSRPAAVTSAPAPGPLITSGSLR